MYHRRNAKHGGFFLGYVHKFSNSKQFMYKLIQIYSINFLAGFLESQTTPYNSNAHSIMLHHTHLPHPHHRLIIL